MNEPIGNHRSGLGKKAQNLSAGSGQNSPLPRDNALDAPLRTVPSQRQTGGTNPNRPCHGQEIPKEKRVPIFFDKNSNCYVDPKIIRISRKHLQQGTYSLEVLKRISGSPLAIVVFDD